MSSARITPHTAFRDRLRLVECRYLRSTFLSRWELYTRPYFAQQAQILSTWLLRSDPLPLSIDIQPELVVPFQALIPIILPHRARWEYVEVYPHVKELIEIVGPMPLLRCLTLSSYSGIEAADTVAIHEAPLLRAVDLNSVARKLTLPFAQLTSLTLGQMYPHECVPILQQTTHLVYCRLSVFADNNVPQPPGCAQDISLPFLKSLNIANYGTDPVTVCFSNLIVPALRHLAIPEHSLRPYPINALSAFIQRSGCTLETVHVSGVLKSRLPEGAYERAFPGVGRFILGGTSEDF
ncbi:hypothetical protein B0H16DRAFT_1542645 [Mycena metata]|uniref:F-box domain-containing protein n=1 Tax=Mycena metata TaxID=1033252 RepID=A0AAD7NCY4_9AGAR|nr:hypothetical protein B0H16DRAFT_1542645 [Mycena metata]